MFSYELTTNPWMYYEISFPPVTEYDVCRLEWQGKNVDYPPMAVFFSGWLGALLDSDHMRTRRFPNYLFEQRALPLAMGLHPRLGLGSLVASLSPDLVKVICLKLDN